MIKKAQRLIALFLSLLISLVALSSLSLGWFGGRMMTPSGGKILPGYFAGGNGSAENPYIITHPIHLYNLAWLQYMGEFNTETNEDGTLKQFHFKVGKEAEPNYDGVLDMSLLGGYKLPPIGTAQYPFIGTFNGNGYTISGLQVSNVLSSGEIVKRPQSVTSVEGVNVVGMFGIIGQYDGVPEDAKYGSIVPKVENFRLDNPMVRTQTKESLIGLLAGYVNGKVHNVGVVQGSIVSGEVNTEGLNEDYGEYISLYSLIGDRGGDVAWGGVSVPGGDAGGDLIIDPNDGSYKNGQSISTVTPVPKSAEGTAYFVPTNNFTSDNAVKGVYLYNKHVSFENSVSPVGGNTSDFYNSTSNWGTKKHELAFKDAYDKAAKPGGKPVFLNPPEGSPDFKNLETYNGKTYPKNTVWFDPMADGKAAIAFVQFNQSSSQYMSIYRFKRNGNTFTDIEELVVTLLPGNKYISYYEFDLKDKDANEVNYEYAIGRPSNSGYSSTTDGRFFFLMLAGADTSGGKQITNTSKELFDVNFVPPNYNISQMVAPEGKPITTFLLELTKTSTPSTATASFSKTSMDDHATISVNGAIKSTIGEHTGVKIPESTPTQ